MVEQTWVLMCVEHFVFFCVLSCFKKCMIYNNDLIRMMIFIKNILSTKEAPIRKHE